MLRPAIKFRSDLCKKRRGKRKKRKAEIKGKVVNQRSVQIYIVRVVYDSLNQARFNGEKNLAIGSILVRTRFGELSGESIPLPS